MLFAIPVQVILQDTARFTVSGDLYPVITQLHLNNDFNNSINNKTNTMNKMKQLVNSTTIRCISFLCLLSVITNYSFAQARWQADVSVTSVTITAVPNLKKVSRPTANINKPTQKVVEQVDENLKCSITVHNENDDDARGTMMIVVLPVEVSVVSMPSNATVDKYVTATQPIAGYITFDLGQMAVQQNITVEFTITKSKYGNKIGAYAYSYSPDPNPANNYKEATY